MLNNIREIINGKQGTEIAILIVVALFASIVHAIKKKYTFLDFVKQCFTTVFMAFLLYILLTHQFGVSIYITIVAVGVCGMVSEIIYNELEILAKEAFTFAKEYLKSKIKK